MTVRLPPHNPALDAPPSPAEPKWILRNRSALIPFPPPPAPPTFRSRLKTGLLVFLLFLAACAKSQNPEPLMPLSNGTRTSALIDRQIAKARTDQFVIYSHEWAYETPGLTDYGLRHLQQIAQVLRASQQYVIIEHTTDSAADQLHRATIAGYLRYYGCPDAERWVIIDRPLASGTPGDEALKVDAGRLQPSLSGSGGSSGSSGAPTPLGNPASDGLQLPIYGNH